MVSVAISSAMWGGDDDHAVAVADDDVTGKHGGVAAADRHVDVDGLVQGEVGGGGGALVERGETEGGDLGGVPEAAIGDDSGGATDHEPGDEDVAGRGGAGVAAAVDHHDVARRAFLDGEALGVGGVLEDVDAVEVLAGGM